jgi:hypothetical protein
MNLLAAGGDGAPPRPNLSGIMPVQNVDIHSGCTTAWNTRSEFVGRRVADPRVVTCIDRSASPPDQLAWPGIATLPGLPATAIPTGFAPDGLPVGVQIVGPWLEDRTPLKLAELIEREFGGFVPPPMFDD